MAPTVETMTFIGAFASDALANAEITNQNWYKKIGLVYWNSATFQLRYWNGSAWKSSSHDPPQAHMTKTVVQSVPNNVWTQATFNFSYFDNASLVVGNTFVIPANSGGVWYLHAGIGFVNLAPRTTWRGGRIRLNGVSSLFETRIPANPTDHTYFTFGGLTKLAAADVITLEARHNNGAGLNLNPTVTHLTIMRTGD